LNDSVEPKWANRVSTQATNAGRCSGGIRPFPSGGCRGDAEGIGEH